MQITARIALQGNVLSMVDVDVEAQRSRVERASLQAGKDITEEYYDMIKSGPSQKAKSYHRKPINGILHLWVHSEAFIARFFRCFAAELV